MEYDWGLIKSMSKFDSLPSTDRDSIARSYFTKNVAGDLSGDELENAYQQWKADNAPEPTNTDNTGNESHELNPTQDAASIKDALTNDLAVLTEGGKTVGKTVANIANTPNDIINLARIGYNYATDSNVEPSTALRLGDLVLPEATRNPTSETGKVISDVAPMLIPSKGALGLAKLAGIAAEGSKAAKAIKAATNVSKALSDTTDDNTPVENYTPKAEALIEANPDKYKDVSKEDLALKLHDADYAGNKALQAIVGSAAPIDATSPALNKTAAGRLIRDVLPTFQETTAGKSLGLAGLMGGAEAAKEAVKSSVSGEDNFDIGDVGLSAIAGGALPLALGGASKLLKPGNATRQRIISDAVKREDEAYARAANAEEDYIASTVRKEEDNGYEPTIADAIGHLTTSIEGKPIQPSPTYNVDNAVNNLLKGSYDSIYPGKATARDLAGLRIAQNALPDVSLRALADYTIDKPIASAIQGINGLPNDVLQSLGTTKLGNLGRNITNATQTGVGARMLERSANKQYGEVTKDAVDKLLNLQKDIHSSSYRPTDTSAITTTIDALRNGTKLDESIYPELSKLSTDDLNIGKLYRDTLDKQNVLSNYTGDKLTVKDGISPTISAALGYLSGGASTLAQAGTQGARAIKDRAVLKDLARVTGHTYAMDNVANKAIDAINAPVVTDAYKAVTTNSNKDTVPEPIHTDSTHTDSIKDDDIDWSTPVKSQESVKDDDIDWGNTTKSEPTTKVSGVANKLYNGITAAETGGITNPWIRTKGKDTSSNLHSSAYGPAQLTYSLANDYLTRHPKLFSDTEKDFLNAYVNQGKLMIAASNGHIKDDKLAYGGEGYLNNDLAKSTYENVVKKMLEDTYKRNNGNLVKTINSWRGTEDPSYIRKVAANI